MFYLFFQSPGLLAWKHNYHLNCVDPPVSIWTQCIAQYCPTRACKVRPLTAIAQCTQLDLLGGHPSVHSMGLCITQCFWYHVTRSWHCTKCNYHLRTLEQMEWWLWWIEWIFVPVLGLLSIIDNSGEGCIGSCHNIRKFLSQVNEPQAACIV